MRMLTKIQVDSKLELHRSKGLRIEWNSLDEIQTAIDSELQMECKEVLWY